jgi:D-galactarolactone cycloisomerase
MRESREATEEQSFGSPERLTIRQIEVIPIVVPLNTTYRGSYYRMVNRATVVVRLLTDEGVVGVAYAADEDTTIQTIAKVIRDEICPLLIGENAFQYGRCWERAFPVTYDQLRDRRISLVALASVDFAIWDAIGKAVGRPLWQLWGGYRDSLPVNVIGGYYGRDHSGLSRLQVQGGWRPGSRGCRPRKGGS